MTPRFLVLSCAAIFLLAQVSPLLVAAPNPPPPAGLVGRYAVPDDQGFIDLRPDGTFTVWHGSESSSGTYTIVGTAVNLVLPGTPMPPLQFANGTLTIGDGVKMARVGNAAPPPAPGASTGSAVAPTDKVNTTRSIMNVKALCMASLMWASKHQGDFPDTLEQLLTKDYAGSDLQVIHCPLLHNDSQPGYVYLGKGLKDSVAGSTVLFLSKWSDPSGKRIVGHVDGSVLAEIPKAADLPRTASITVVPAKPGTTTTGTPLPSSTPTTATTSTTPAAPGSVKITLSASMSNDNRYGVIFPKEQMPADLKGYFWVTDRPDQRTNVAPVKFNTWYVSNAPGVYKVRVEYRWGSLKQQVSNTFDVTVPPSAK